jgi:hypothetical protein
MLFPAVFGSKSTLRDRKWYRWRFYRLVGQALRENAECTLRPTLSTLADLAETFQALTMSMFALSRSYLPC